MKKSIFLLFLTVILLVSISYASVPDADQDGVPDSEDICPDSDTTIVDQFGCSCQQKNCPSDDNPCTDDCSVIDGLPSCTFANNEKPCPGGYCYDGKCKTIEYPLLPNATSFIRCVFEGSDKVETCYYRELQNFGYNITGCSGTDMCDFNITSTINKTVYVYSTCSGAYNVTINNESYEVCIRLPSIR